MYCFQFSGAPHPCSSCNTCWIGLRLWSTGPSLFVVYKFKFRWEPPITHMQKWWAFLQCVDSWCGDDAHTHTCGKGREEREERVTLCVCVPIVRIKERRGKREREREEEGEEGGDEWEWKLLTTAKKKERKKEHKNTSILYCSTLLYYSY